MARPEALEISKLAVEYPGMLVRIEWGTIKSDTCTNLGLAETHLVTNLIRFHIILSIISYLVRKLLRNYETYDITK